MEQRVTPFRNVAPPGKQITFLFGIKWNRSGDCQVNIAISPGLAVRSIERMNVTLQKHEAKHIYKVPEGLRELCTDISREVLRSQPANMYAFIAEYVDTLLITRENTKIAVKVVNNILLGSQAILCILYRTGFTLEQITVAAPRIQKAFREYLDAADMRPIQICDDQTCEEGSMISIRKILETTGASYEDAERAATIIQAAFRGHYERMALNEAEGKVQWQRAVSNTVDILKKAGATQYEIAKAVRHIKFAYRGYYTRRNQRIDGPESEKKTVERDERILEPVEAIQAVAWMEMMYNDSGLTLDKANEAASIIQRAYKKYRARNQSYDVQQIETAKTMVAEAVIDNVHQKIFTKVTSLDDIPKEFGSRMEMMSQSARLQFMFKERLRMTRLKVADRSDHDEFEEQEEEEEEVGEEEEGTDEEEFVTSTPPVKPKFRPVEERLPKEEAMEEQLPSDSDTTTERLPASPELQSETEPPTDAEFKGDTEDETEEDENKAQEEQTVAEETVVEEKEEHSEHREEAREEHTMAMEGEEETEHGEIQEKETKAAPETSDGVAE